MDAVTAGAGARHHVRIGRSIFCADEWVERPIPGRNVTVIRCPHEHKPLRTIRVRPTLRLTPAAALLARVANGKPAR